MLPEAVLYLPMLPRYGSHACFQLVRVMPPRLGSAALAEQNHGAAGHACCAVRTRQVLRPSERSRMAHAVRTRVTLPGCTDTEPCGHARVLRRPDFASELSSQQRTAEAAAKLDTAGATRVLAPRATATTQDGGERSTTPEVLLGLWSVSYRALVGVV